MKTAFAIGNDIVDLLEIKTHPRFAERICTIEELSFISTSPKLVWVYWAIKEATYKAVKKICPNARFIPRLFRITDQVCYYKKYAAKIKWTKTEEYIHATALLSRYEKGVTIYTSVGPCLNHISESDQVRKLAKALLKNINHPDCQIIRDKKNGRLLPPKIFKNGKRASNLDISLSHDGRFVASAILEN